MNLIDNVEMTMEPFGESTPIEGISQELYSKTPLSQVGSKGSPFKAHAHLTTESHTCTSNLKSDDDTVDLRVHTGKKQSVEQDDISTQSDPLCLCSKALSQASCRDGESRPCSLQQSPGDQMDASRRNGLNDTPLLAPLLESDNPPLPLGGAAGKTRVLTKKWLLQENGSYVPVFVEKPAHPFVSSMIPLSNDKPVDSRPGVNQT